MRFEIYGFTGPKSFLYMNVFHSVSFVWFEYIQSQNWRTNSIIAEKLQSWNQNSR